MIFHSCKLAGVYLIELTYFEDERGFFAPSFSRRVFEERGLTGDFVENNISYNRRSGTLRGLHFQVAPYAQAKLVRCTRGSIFDVAVDLRRDSPTFRQWVGHTLSSDNRLLMYIPGEMAHGFQTLEDDTEVFYQVSEIYQPNACAGLRWNDPAFGIEWPLPDDPIILDRDSSYPDFGG
ncbi:MAG TPA: dTDP-4-dehydrorhamnose 3,5-epimerase [Pyrinomonadaceae bacterium]|jgi:dTDP-4-dehydrorhamnose 3,5-epimerase